MITTHRRKDRPLEWFLAGFSCVWGVAVMGAPGVVALAPHELTVEALGTPRLAVMSALLGIAQMIALLVNGTAAWTPFARLLTTAANAGFFAWVAGITLQLHDVGPSALIYGYTALGFVWSAWVAGEDAARMRLGTYGLD